MDAHQTSIFTVVLIIALVVGVIFAYFIITLIRHHRRNAQLYKAKMFAEITTLENERKRMSADLHDELGPILAGVKLKLNSLDVTDKDDEVTLRKIHENIDELINRMKGISNDLMPSVLLKRGLAEAIEVTVEEINRSKNIDITFIHQALPGLTEDKVINLYRIVQEIIHNTLKHAQATGLTIEIKTDVDKLVVLTHDDGKGFNYTNATKETPGHGLRNLLTRTEALGGNMYIDTAVGKGTTYIFEVPLPINPSHATSE